MSHCQMESTAQIRVGFALTEKKKQSFLKNSFIEHARSNGIYCHVIDISMDLSDQGHFDIIVHKIRSEAWFKMLIDYKSKYPKTVVLDFPESIKKLENRESMLEVLRDIDVEAGNVAIPRQLAVNTDTGNIEKEIDKAGLNYPLVAKPIVADGSELSHKMFLVNRREGLKYLQGLCRPKGHGVVLQEFVNHGGVLFKVYVVGYKFDVVRRQSLPDYNDSDDEMYAQQPIKEFDRISCYNPEMAESNKLSMEDGLRPPQPLIEKLAKELRNRLKLHLFNFDIIRDGASQNYYVIDINYFPGLSKMPNYEKHFTEFLLGLAEGCEPKINNTSICSQTHV